MSYDTIIQNAGTELLNTKAFIDQIVNVAVSPQNAQGISGWLFDVPGQEAVNWSADVTDHYTENNSYINDHVVIKPVEITLSGYIGELVYRKPQGYDAVINALSNSLTRVSAFAGEYSDGLSQKLQNFIEEQLSISAINQKINNAENIINELTGESPFTKLQRKAYNEIKSMFLTKQLVTVQTPWEYFEDMIIIGISATQGEDSETITDFTIILKQLRFSDVEYTKFDENLFPVREIEQASDTEDSGTIKGRNSSFLFEASEAAGF